MEEKEKQQLAGDGDGIACGDRSKEEAEERKKQRTHANAHAFVCSLSLLLAATMALMLLSYGGSPLWLASELAAVLCLLLYLWAYHVTQNLAAGAGAAVPVEALVFAFPLVFGAGFLAALLAVAVAPVAGVLVMGADVAGVSALFGFCLAEYLRHNEAHAAVDGAAPASVET
ncbi:hypothetical protein OsI_02856 [Oryza sativa Indica Group]|jgi:hypothetical protein|uniref:Uncharacterized protein n=1 Tax=Oryza sativa subsp. indica TaxID=39946 RepID=A2WSL3_ORYSI|nr:hypothetical protein OsI_02856 [Oryza sativa Indica Group]